jgi:DNA polymerase III epsilon subunit-like protein
VYCDDLSSATFTVVDVETTGLDPKSDRVVEIGCVRLRGGRIVERFGSFVNPGRPIPPHASAIHGIFDCDVAAAPTLTNLRSRIVGLADQAVVVAHNARFDLGFLPFIADRPALCTLQLARRLVDAPNYRNETLRDFLQIRSNGRQAPAHRAQADVEVTAAVLLELLRRFREGPHEPTVSAVFASLAKPAFLERFVFGAHRGKAMRAVPTSYLRWILGAGFENWPDVRHTALLELRRREVSM